MATDADVCLVLGSQNSSNSQRLAELAKDSGVVSHLIDGAADINPDWFQGGETVLVTAGASAPETVVEECIDWLKARYNAEVEVRMIREENVHFPFAQKTEAIAKRLTNVNLT